MMLNITGTIVPGQGDAHRNHQFLIPKLAEHFAEIAGCRQFGTINVRLDMPLLKGLADHWTPRIKWRPYWLTPSDPDREEAFGFIRIKFECPLGGRTYDAWVIVPELAQLSQDEFGAEVIADMLVLGVRYGVSCAIQLDDWPPLLRPTWFGRR
jgi:CTP-dependent riboflavin kinase